MAIAIIISLIIAFFGLFMVNKVGNYETIWGFLMIGGAIATALLSLISIGIFIYTIL